MPRLINVILGPLTSPRMKGRLWKHWYRYFDRRIEASPLRFMNYGFAAANDAAIALDPDDEAERTSIQLYHRVLGGAALDGATVVEVSCGRGGGADYAARCMKPRLVVALDRTESALGFCRKRYSATNLSFVCGDALGLPFFDARFDAVVNVEASHCYPDVPLFFSEVRRVLKPGGHFLYADFRRAGKLSQWREQIAASGLTIIEEEDLTRGVVAALSKTHESKVALIRKVAPKVLRSAFSQFAGTQGSMMYRAFDKGRANYLRFVLRKT